MKLRVSDGMILHPRESFATSEELAPQLQMAEQANRGCLGPSLRSTLVAASLLDPAS